MRDGTVRSMPPAAADDRSWLPLAACKNHPDPDLFFPHRHTPIARIWEAKQICGGCPVKAECLAEAIRHPPGQTFPPGIWGGTTERERRNARRGKARRGS